MSTPSSDNTTYVKASCLCRSNEFLVSFLTSTLPQASHLCHCSICRHTTGQLGVDGAVTTSGPLALVPNLDGATPIEPQAADLSKLSTYNVTPALTRFFCNTCGAYMLYKYRTSADQLIWGISTGSLERTEGIVQLRYHVHLRSTKDGGLSNHYRAVNAVELNRYAGWGKGEFSGLETVEVLPVDWEDDTLPALKKKFDTETHAHCHCRQISLRFTRPSQEDGKDPSKWWIIPGDDSGNLTGHKLPRFFGAHCFCSSCRLSHGSAISSCVLIPRTNVFIVEGSNITLSASSPSRPANLTQYSSSQNTYREFCSTCGASVFWWTLQKSDSMVPVEEGASEPVFLSLSAGLMDEEEGGALSEGWVSWTEQLGFPEDALDKSVVEAVQEGLRGRSTPMKR